MPPHLMAQPSPAFRALRGGANLVRQVTGHAVAGSWALLCGRVNEAGGRARLLLEIIHEDCVRFLEIAQRVLPFARVRLDSVDRILVVKLDRVGDVVNTTPVIEALHRKYPCAAIDIVGHPGPLSLLSNDPRIRERLPYKSSLYHTLPILPPVRGWPIVFKLLRRRYPLVVYLRGSFPFLLLWFTSRVAAARFTCVEPTIRRYMKPLDAIFGPQDVPPLSLSLDPRAMEATKSLLEPGGRRTRRVVLHATCQDPTKQWPLKRFAEVADRLAARGMDVHFLGSAEDAAKHATIAGHCTASPSFHRTLTLQQTAAAIASSELFIGVDSGLSHVAAAVGTPMIITWGFEQLEIAKPLAAPSRLRILYHDVPCREGCPRYRCSNPNQFVCLTAITVDQVVEAAEDLLGHSRNGVVPIPETPSTSATGALT